MNFLKPAWVFALTVAAVACKQEKRASPAIPSSPSLAATAEPTYVLATRNLIPPTGTLATIQSSTGFKNGKIIFTSNGTDREGVADNTEIATQTFEVLSPDKCRKVVERRTTTYKTTIDGHTQFSPSRPDPLKTLPVIIERKDGKWTIGLESGISPTPAQAKKLSVTLAKFEADENTQMYGETPRKPGDKWNVDPSGLISFGDPKTLTGTFTVEFLKVADFHEIRCAVLKSEFDIKGKTLPEDDSPASDIQIKGQAMVYRSIADQCDIDVTVNSDLKVDGGKSDSERFHIEAPTVTRQTVTLSKPTK